MKMVMAVIKPFKLDDVREALTAIGVEGLTVTEVRGFGRQKGRSDHDGIGDSAPTFLPKVKIEVGIPAALEEKAVAAIRNAANTGKIGDGKIFVYDMSSALRIRTGDAGEAAL